VRLGPTSLTSEITATGKAAKKKVPGWPKLEKALGVQGKAVVHDFRDWLGLLRRRAKRAPSPLLQAPFAEEVIWEVDGQGNKVPARIAANVQVIVTNDLRAEDDEDEPLVYHDDFAGVPMLADAPPWASRDVPYPREMVDSDIVGLQGWLLGRWGLFMSKEAVWDGTLRAAELAARHAVQDYLRGLGWDGVERLSSVGQTYFRADDDDYTRQVIRMWMISAVARAMAPGCQVSHVLVLEGRTQIGKSSGLRALCPNELWFSDAVLDMRLKDGALALRGTWIMEIAELASIQRSDVETVKEYLTRRIDKYRPPYGKLSVMVPRSNVFACTVNPDQDDGYLRDTTGNARFWPVTCRGDIDTEGLACDRDQLWAEARASAASWRTSRRATIPGSEAASASTHPVSAPAGTGRRWPPCSEGCARRSSRTRADLVAVTRWTGILLGPWSRPRSRSRSPGPSPSRPRKRPP